MELNSLSKITARSHKRLGRGHGSGKGKTGGRGTKGQKSRENIKVRFEGGQLALLKRLPLSRGKGRNKSFKKNTIIVNIKHLNLLPEGSIVDKELLVKEGIILAADAKVFKIKILGDGELKSPFTIKLPVSKKAKVKIEKAGGKIINE